MKKFFTVIITIILFLLAIGFVAINLVDKEGEKQLSYLLDDMIVENRLEDKVSYSSLEVSAKDGLVVINDLEFIDSDIGFNANSLEIKLPFSDIISLVKDSSSKTITDLNISGKDIVLSIKNDNITLKQDELKLHFNGNVNTSIFESNSIPKDSNLMIKELGIDSSGTSITSDVGTVDCDTLFVNASGNLKLSDLLVNIEESDAIGILNNFENLEQLSLNLEGANYDADEKTKSMVSMIVASFLDDSSIVDNQENWKIDKLDLKMGFDENLLSIKDLSLKNNLMDFNCQASLSIDELSQTINPLDLTLRVNEYNEDLRPIFNMVALSVSDTTLPDGGFLLDIEMPEDNSFPVVKFEELN